MPTVSNLDMQEFLMFFSWHICAPLRELRGKTAFQRSEDQSYRLGIQSNQRTTKTRQMWKADKETQCLCTLKEMRSTLLMYLCQTSKAPTKPFVPVRQRIQYLYIMHYEFRCTRTYFCYIYLPHIIEVNH